MSAVLFLQETENKFVFVNCMTLFLQTLLLILIQYYERVTYLHKSNKTHSEQGNTVACILNTKYICIRSVSSNTESQLQRDPKDHLFSCTP